MRSLDEVFLVTLDVLLFISCGVTGVPRGGGWKQRALQSILLPQAEGTKPIIAQRVIIESFRLKNTGFQIQLIRVLCSLCMSKTLLLWCGHGLLLKTLVRESRFPHRLLFPVASLQGQIGPTLPASDTHSRSTGVKEDEQRDSWEHGAVVLASSRLHASPFDCANLVLK